jgi:LmbE family N-acetylglucosaminyl deacetylase
MNDESTSPQKVLLAVLAHPDDESFGTGGTLAYYAQNGVHVYLICATRGEAGEMEERYLRNFESIAERREAELRCAAEKLGIKQVFFLNYRDSGMAGSRDNLHPEALVNQPLEKVASDISSIVEKLKPQVIITFDPIGGYRHPDHIAIHKATVQAFQAFYTAKATPQSAGSKFVPQKLYFHTIPKGMLKVGVFLMRIFGKDPRKFGKNKDVDLLSLTEVDFPTHAMIYYYPVIEIRQQASECHASQGGGRMTRGPFGWLQRLLGAHDTYMRAYPPVSSKEVERDLFDGI